MFLQSGRLTRNENDKRRAKKDQAAGPDNGLNIHCSCKTIRNPE